DDSKMRESLLQKEIEGQKEKFEENEKQENPDPKEIFAIREKYRPLTSLFQNKTGFQEDKIERKINSASGKKLVRKLRRKNDLETRIK
ncbi:29887_t:CDS:2, partial [Racocetra persica]